MSKTLKDLSKDCNYKRAGVRSEQQAALILSEWTQLAGSVVSRQPSKKRPGIVLIPGGGAQKRDNLQSLWWAYNGFRALTYDKRGVGHSSGVYREASILDLAADAVFAVSAVRSDPLTD